MAATGVVPRVVNEGLVRGGTDPNQLFGLGDKGQKVLGTTYRVDPSGNHLYFDGARANFPGGPQVDQWKQDLERQALDLNRAALSRGDLSSWNLYNRAAAPQFGPSGMPLTQQGTDSITTGKVWMPDANDPAAKFFTPEALKALYLQGGAGTDGGYGKVNVGSLDQYLGTGAKNYLMAQGVEGADDDKHKITFYDPTKPYWGADAFKEKSKLRGNAESVAKAVGTAVAMYTGGAAIAAGAGALGGAAGAAEAGTAGAAGAGAGAGTSSGILGSSLTTGSALGDTMAAGAIKGAGMGALSGGAQAGMSGGNIWKGALKGAGTGALTGGVGAGVSAGLSAIPSTSSYLGSGLGSQVADSAIKQGISGAVTGGLRSGLSGGNILAGAGQGALGGAVGGAVSTGVNNTIDLGNRGANDIVRGAAGGALTGGINSLIKNKNVQTGLLTGAIGGLSSGVGKAVSGYTDSSVLGGAAKAGLGYLTQNAGAQSQTGARPATAGTAAAPAAQQQKLAAYGQMIDNYLATKGINAATAQKRQMLQALLARGG